ncbi:hypothetical protein NFJ02_29g67810 [Pycnococcus provasolii]
MSLSVLPRLSAPRRLVRACARARDPCDCARGDHGAHGGDASRRFHAQVSSTGVSRALSVVALSGGLLGAASWIAPPSALAAEFLGQEFSDDLLPEGFLAGVIILVVRVVTFSGAMTAMEYKIEASKEDLDKRGIRHDDLLVQPGQEAEDKWYLVGDWKPPKVGEPVRGKSYYLGQLRLRVRIDDCEKKCKELGINYGDVDDVIAASQLKSSNPVQARYNELADRIKAKEAELGIKSGGLFG